jgi:hypothetical protein
MVQDTYCMLIVGLHGFSAKYSVSIEIAQNEISAEYMEEIERYSSGIDALNFMASLGWELVNTVASQSLSTTHYIMKKKA